MATTAEQLTSVRAAIAAIEAGAQATRHGDTQVTMADLSTLYQREKDLMARLASENAARNGRGRNRVSYVVPD